MVAQTMPNRATTRRRHDTGAIRAGIVGTGLVVLVGLVGLLYISQSSAVATVGYDLKRLEAERAQMLARNEQLRLEIGQLESLARIEEAATRIGMAPPERLLFVQVPASAVQKRAAEPAPAASRPPALATTNQPDLLGKVSTIIRQLRDGAVAFSHP